MNNVKIWIILKDWSKQNYLLKRLIWHIKRWACINKDCEHVVRVWNEIVMKNTGNYHDLSLKNDVLLLKYLFEEFSTNQNLMPKMSK